MTFVGFDLHMRYITACALDAAGEILAKTRQLSTSLETAIAWLSALPGPVTVGLEAPGGHCGLRPDLATRRRRQLLRGRAFLVRERTPLKNRIHGHLMSENLVPPGADLYGKGGRAWLASAPLEVALHLPGALRIVGYARILLIDARR